MLGGDRLDRVSELLRHELGELLSREVNFKPGVLVTITRITVSPDLEHAKVWVSVLPAPESDDVFLILHKEVGHLQHLLNQALVMRPLPRIRFERDQSADRAEGIERLLDTLE